MSTALTLNELTNIVYFTAVGGITFLKTSHNIFKKSICIEYWGKSACNNWKILFLRLQPLKKAILFWKNLLHWDRVSFPSPPPGKSASCAPSRLCLIFENVKIIDQSTICNLKLSLPCIDHQRFTFSQKQLYLMLLQAISLLATFKITYNLWLFWITKWKLAKITNRKTSLHYWFSIVT